MELQYIFVIYVNFVIFAHFIYARIARSPNHSQRA